MIDVNDSQDTSPQLATLLELSRQIQVSIEEGNWLGATELDLRRQMLLAELCANLEPQSCAPEVLRALGEMVKLNDALVAVVEQRQDAILRDAQVVGLGRRAVAAYGSV